MAKSDVSAVVNYFPTVNEGFTTTIGGGGVTAPAATVTLTSTSGLVNGSIFVGIVDPGQTNEQVFTGTVSTGTNTITGVKWTRGTNVAHAAGATVVDYVTGTAINMISAGFLKEHTQTGAHGALTVTSLTSSGAISGTTLSASGAASLTSLTTTGNITVGGKTSPHVTSLTPAATLTPDANTTNICECVGLNTGTAIAAPTGSPTNMQPLTIRIKDDGTSRAISWNATYVPIGVTLPTATTVNKVTYVSMRYSSNSSRWEVLSVGREA